MFILFNINVNLYKFTLANNIIFNNNLIIINK